MLLMIGADDDPSDVTAVGVSQNALRAAGLAGDKEDWYVVGTYDDLRRAMEDKRGFKFPPEK